MSRDDDKKPAMPNVENRPNLTGFTPEAEAWMHHRTREIQKATQRKGMPMTWGAGKGPIKVPPMPPRETD